MIASTSIKKNIKQLLKLYNDAHNPKKELYYSKLAVIELCGWIEESMDNVVIMCGNRLIRESTNKKYISGTIVRRNYGFEYDQFRKMLMHVIGMVNVEKVERKIDPLKFALLKSTLGSLNGPRNSAAHTYIKGVALSIDAPSVTLNNFNIVYDGLIDFDSSLRGLGL